MKNKIAKCAKLIHYENKASPNSESCFGLYVSLKIYNIIKISDIDSLL